MTFNVSAYVSAAKPEEGKMNPMQTHRATFAKGVGVLTRCCDAAVVIQIDGALMWSSFCGGCLQNAPGALLAVPLTLKESWDWTPGERAPMERGTDLRRPVLEIIDEASSGDYQNVAKAAPKSGPSIRAMLRLMKVCAVEVLKRALQLAKARTIR